MLQTILDELASTRNRKNAVKIFFGGGEPDGKRSVGRARQRQDDDIKMDLNEVG
jgi:hypothetical protein